jgi:hypothetical protein
LFSLSLSDENERREGEGKRQTEEKRTGYGLAWATKVQLLVCFLKAKTAFYSSPKAVKSCKNSAFWPIYCIFITYEKFTAFLFAFEKQKFSFVCAVPRPTQNRIYFIL